MAVGKLVEDSLGHGNSSLQLKDFIYTIFQNSHESQKEMMVPMIYNLAYKYQQNKPLIDALFTKFSLTKNPKGFVEAFANIILTPSLYDPIAAKLTKDTEKNAKILEQIRPTVEMKWGQYLDNLSVQKDKIQLEIDKLRAFIKTTKDYAVKSEFEKSLKTEVEKISKIDRVLSVDRYHQTFLKTQEELMMANLNIATIKAQTNNFAFTSMLAKDMDATKII